MMGTRARIDEAGLIHHFALGHLQELNLPPRSAAKQQEYCSFPQTGQLPAQD
jgi:hypothetical protein